MGQERKGVPESPGGHGRQPARRRHSGRVHRLLPMVHVPSGMHRHRRRAGHGMPGQRHGPVQGKLYPRRGAGIELPASLRHRLRQERHRGTDGRMTPLFYLVGEESPCLQPLCPRIPQTVIPATFSRHPRESPFQSASKPSSGHPLCGDTPQRPACFRKKLLLNVKKRRLLKKIRYFCVRRHACKTLLLF